MPDFENPMSRAGASEHVAGELRCPLCLAVASRFEVSLEGSIDIGWHRPTCAVRASGSVELFLRWQVLGAAMAFRELEQRLAWVIGRARRVYERDGGRLIVSEDWLECLTRVGSRAALDACAVAEAHGFAWDAASRTFRKQVSAAGLDRFPYPAEGAQPDAISEEARLR